MIRFEEARGGAYAECADCVDADRVPLPIFVL